ncbi:hypothetical protein [Jhaorihella thermophila]|uniref:Uncharacterized protein n=1 Tax=Jhaorihella thermophila TaxID=488547 RepID=A0A1H5X8V8_9RHOB|nr:hypothetical protein [Jhaorihella thermophila]SEG08172.1 hypothetical protein SAMN05421751_11049 [Jhaorihella thermophila]
MDDKDRLRKKIARLGDAVPLTPGGARRLSADAGGRLIDALLAEIAETVMPRVLIVEDDGGAELARVSVAGRRILSLRTGQRVVTGADFDEVDDFAVALASGLRAALGGRAQAGLRTAREDEPPGEVGLRCSTAAVAAVLGDQMTGAEGLSRYVRALGPHVAAWRVTGPDGAVTEGGDAAWLAQVPDADPATLTARLDQALAETGPDGMIHYAGGGDGRELILARSRGALLVALLRDGDRPDPVGIWRRLVGA